MITHRCRNCIWWDNRHQSIHMVPLQFGKEDVGFCRRRKAGALRIESHFYGVHPIMDAAEFCGEFKGES